MDHEPAPEGTPPPPTETTPPAPARYLVEHRTPGETEVLAVLGAVTGGRHLLDPYVSRLLHEGGDGLVALVEAGTGRLVASRVVAPPEQGLPPSAGRPRRFPRRPARGPA